MAESYGVVSLQIYILCLGGVWPVLIKPFQKHLKINIICATCTCILIILRSLSIGTNVMIYGKSTTRTFVVFLLTLISDVLASMSILHICIFKYDKLLSRLSLLAKYQNGNIKIKIFLWIATVAVQGSLGFVTYNFSIQFTTEAFIKYSFSGTNTEAWILMVLYLFGCTINIFFIPVLIILGLSLIIRKQFNILQSQLSESVVSKEVYRDETSFNSFKLNFEEICDTVACLDETFKYYILISLTGTGIFILSDIYNQAVGCISLKTFVAYTVLDCFALLCLSVSGAVISQAVS